MREYMEESCNAVDAAIFSGDILYCDDDREKLKEYVRRWLRAIDEHEAVEAAEAVNRLRSTLAELVGVVRGECPSLLDGDSGGNDRLALEIDELLMPNAELRG